RSAFVATDASDAVVYPLSLRDALPICGLQGRGGAPREAIAQLTFGDRRNADLRHGHFGDMVIESKALFRDGVAGSTSVQQIASVHRSNNSRFCGGSSLRLTRKSSKARGSALRASSLKLKNASQEAGLRDRITSPVF